MNKVLFEGVLALSPATCAIRVVQLAELDHGTPMFTLEVQAPDSMGVRQWRPFGPRITAQAAGAEGDTVGFASAAYWLARVLARVTA